MGPVGISRTSGRSRWLLRGTTIASVAAAVVVVALWPTTTRYGVNFVVFSKQIPLYEKAINFVSRDLQGRRLASEITAGATNDRARLQRIFTWVDQNVRPVPAGFPVLDDHLWNVITRGYGAADQRTEVFTLLASYSCCAGTLMELNASPTDRIMVAVVELDGKPRVFDVVNQLIFRNESGDFASIDDLARNPAIVAAASGGLHPSGIPYTRYFSEVARLRPAYTRMEIQKPWQRLKAEVRHVFIKEQ